MFLDESESYGLVLVALCNSPVPIPQRTFDGAAKTKRSKGGGDSDLSGIVRPELVNAQTDPTLRFPVMSTAGSAYLRLAGHQQQRGSLHRSAAHPQIRPLFRLCPGLPSVTSGFNRDRALVQGSQEVADADLSTPRSLGISPHGSWRGRGCQPRKFGDSINLQDAVEFRWRDGAGEASRPSARTRHCATRGASASAQACRAAFSARDCAVIPSRRRGEPDPRIE